MKNNTKRTQRSPEEIIAETEERLSRLRQRQAKAEAQSDPDIKFMMSQKDDILKAIRESKKILGAGPQSAIARIDKHAAWIEKIKQETILAAASLEENEKSLLVATDKINDRIQGLIKD